MSTKPKAAPAKKSPAKTPAISSPIKPPKEQSPEVTIKVTKSAETTNITRTSILGYEVGLDESGVTHYRICANDEGRFLMAVLQQEGPVQRMAGKTRLFVLTDTAHKLAS